MTEYLLQNDMIKQMLSEIKSQIDEYVKGKTWYWYVPLWLFGLYVFILLLSFNPNNESSFIIAIPQSFDFFLHEMAHIITAFLPSILTAAAGSLSELLLGVLLVLGAFKSKSYSALLICALWFMLTCQSAGIYMADARAQKLALVSLGGALSGSDKTIHDWNFVFGKLHILSLDTFIGDSVRAVGILVGITSLIFAAWLINKMALAKNEKALTTEETQLLTMTAATSGVDTNVSHKGKQESSRSIYPTASRGPLADREPNLVDKKLPPQP